MSDPIPIAFALFAFTLAVYGARFVDVTAATVASGPLTEALNYAILVGGLAETLAGVLAIIRGMDFPAYVTATFGLWLIGFYLLATTGAANKTFTPDAFAWYVLFLAVPVAILAVPPIVHRNIPFIIAFVALLALLLLLGTAYHEVNSAVNTALAHKTAPSLSGPVDLLKVSAYCSFVAAVTIWYVFAKDVYRLTGVLKNPQ